jgi:hypothetical protein
VGAGVVNNAERILCALDAKLDKSVELTLYGRAAFVLGFKNAPKEFALSKDIDAILSIGQADELARTTNFWEAIEEVNREFRDQELYISHLFEEDQVILTFKWRDQRVRINGPWKNLKVYRLGDVDLLLSKLMRNDAQDVVDAKFVVDQAGWNQNEIRQIIQFGTRARYPRNSRTVYYLHGLLFEPRATDEKTSAAWIGGDCSSEV